MKPEWHGLTLFFSLMFSVALIFAGMIEKSVEFVICGVVLLVIAKIASKKGWGKFE